MGYWYETGHEATVEFFSQVAEENQVKFSDKIEEKLCHDIEWLKVTWAS